MNLKLIEESELKEIKNFLLQITTELQKLTEASSDTQKIGKWLPEKEARTKLGKGQTTIWKMRMKGLLEWTKIGNRVYISEDSILQHLEQNKQNAYAKN